jgi:hypothetical protein
MILPAWFLLVCDWLHSIRQNPFYVMILIIQGCYFIQSLHFSCELQEDYVQDSKQCSSVPLHPSRRCVFPSGCSSVKASSVWMMRFFRPDVHLCPEASNCSRLHSSGRLSHTSRRLSVFDKLKDFFPKHRHGKTAATVRTTWLFCPDAILDKASRAEDVQPSGHQTLCCGHSSLNMEIACS